MQELFQQLGIDWKLFASQAVNFGLLIVALRIFAYKPLLKIMRERREKIAQGLTKAEEADRRLHDANVQAKDVIKEAENEGLSLLRKTEEQAKALEARLVEQAHEKETMLMAEAAARAKAKTAETEEVFRKEAAALVKMAIVRTVELSPDAIDKELINRAVAETKRAGK